MDNVALRRDLYDAFGRGDIPTVLGTMSSDVRWYQAEGIPTDPAAKPGGDRTPTRRALRRGVHTH